MGLYCGIDLHATNRWLCVIDEAGRARLEKRVPNRLDVVRSRLEPLREELTAVAVESTERFWNSIPTGGRPGSGRDLHALAEVQSLGRNRSMPVSTLGVG